MTKIGYAAMLEQFHPTELLDLCAPGRGGRLRRRVHGLRALPSVDAAAGPERVRLELHGRARPADVAAVRDRRDLPGLPLPPGGHRPCRRDPRGDVPGPVLARARCRRGAQRARRRGRVAGDRRPQLDAVRGDRDHRQAVRRSGRAPPRRALPARERAALHPPRGAGQDLRGDRRAGQREADRPAGRRDDHGRGGRREDRACSGAGSTRAPGRPARIPTGMPKLLQIHVSWAPTDAGGDGQRDPRMAERWDAVPQAGHQEPGGLRRDGPAGPPGGLRQSLPHQLATLPGTPASIQHYVDMGFDEIHIHNVGRNQAEFIDVFGREVLPELTLG